MSRPLPRRLYRPRRIALTGVMSTRRLIIAALACGLAILVAFSVQLALAR
jgi:hypothetical protein